MRTIQRIYVQTEQGTRRPITIPNSAWCFFSVETLGYVFIQLHWMQWLYSHTMTAIGCVFPHAFSLLHIFYNYFLLMWLALTSAVSLSGSLCGKMAVRLSMCTEEGRLVKAQELALLG